MRIIFDMLFLATALLCVALPAAPLLRQALALYRRDGFVSAALAILAFLFPLASMALAASTIDPQPVAGFWAQMWATIVANKAAFIALGLTVGPPLIATIISAVQKPPADTSAARGALVRALTWLQLWLTARAPKGYLGIGGTQWSTPFGHVPERDSLPAADTDPGKKGPPTGGAATAILIGFLCASTALQGCATMRPIDQKQYAINFGACMEQKGINDATNVGGQIFQILETPGLTQAQITQRIEGLGIPVAGQAVEDCAICAVQAWQSLNPITGQVLTPAQAAARVFVAKHTHKAPGLRGSPSQLAKQHPELATKDGDVHQIDVELIVRIKAGEVDLSSLGRAMVHDYGRGAAMASVDRLWGTLIGVPLTMAAQTEGWIRKMPPHIQDLAWLVSNKETWASDYATIKGGR